MFSFKASLATGDADRHLAKLLAPGRNFTIFQLSLRRLRRLSAAAAACPLPWPAPNLVVTPEIHYQSELWLPLADIRPVFERFYCWALSYPPILSSTPFADATSWAGIVSGLPAFVGSASHPATLLERLLEDGDLRTMFLCWSFMPRRFYGDGSDRYPGQAAWIGAWLDSCRQGRRQLRCLDAACGAGSSTYGVARLLLECGWAQERFKVEGWTLDPLEAWAAAHASFPHDSHWTAAFRREVSLVFASGAARSMTFRSTDLLADQIPAAGQFDLILCNGLLGGPIIHAWRDLELVTGKLTGLLAPGGMLLAADHFHGGWKKQCPQDRLQALFKQYGLNVFEAGEGLGGLKPDQ